MRNPLVLRNLRLALRHFPQLSLSAQRSLCSLSIRLRLEIQFNHLTLIEGAWYVTHAGLLTLAAREGFSGLQVAPILKASNPERHSWVIRATVFRSSDGRGFDGIGDASPENVPEGMRGSELRIAETRAINRAIRHAYAVGLCSAEELSNRKIAASVGRTSLRVRLNAVITQYGLDPKAVKAYARDYCDVANLASATPGKIAAFIQHLQVGLVTDAPAIRCLLAGYSPNRKNQLQNLQ